MFKKFDDLRYDCRDDGTCSVDGRVNERSHYNIPCRLPSGEIVTGINRGAFYYCTDLTSINIPETVTEIGGLAFYYCCNLTSINIPKGVTEIWRGTFDSCLKLTSIDIPEGVTEICTQAFHNCSNLTSVNIPKSITRIGAGAFERCYKLTSIKIPEGVTRISAGAFNECLNLASIDIPKSVTEIGLRAFCGTKLTKPGFFKATDDNMRCRDFQYTLEETYETPEAELCKCGFHYCENAFDLFSYYRGKIGEEVRLFKVLPEEISEEREDDSKRVCKKITFLEEIKSYHDLLN